MNYIHYKFAGTVKVIGIPLIPNLPSSVRIYAVAGVLEKVLPSIFTTVIDLSDEQLEVRKMFNGYKLMDPPDTIIVDAEGIIRYKLTGVHSSNDIEAILKEIITGK